MTECANPKCEHFSKDATTCCCRKCSNNLNSIKNAEKRKVEREQRQQQFFIDNPQPKCANPECDNMCYFRERYWKWSVCCSNSCVSKYTQHIAKQNKESYDKKISQALETRKKNWVSLSEDERKKITDNANRKRKQTWLEKYGTENIQEVTEIVAKRKQTIQERYGVDSTFESKEIQDKITQTIQERYGVCKPLQNTEIKQKQRQTNLERYGCEEPGGLFMEKAKETTRDRHGCDHYTQTDEYQQRRRNTMMEKYGGVSSSYVNYTELGRELMKPENFSLLVDLNQKMSLAEISVTHGMSAGALTQRFAANNVEPKIHYTSMFHKQVVNFLHEECGITNIIENDRTIISPREIDIVVGNIGIECNGVFWHSERQIMETKKCANAKTYHLDKTIKAREAGIDLLHLWQHMWDQKRDICESIIKSKFGLYDRVVYGRCTEVRVVDKKNEHWFLSENHIQGYVPSTVCIGLYVEDELLSVMSFATSRYTKQYQFELLRFCNKLNTTIKGGASKLFKYFTQQYKPKNIISYCHKHLFNGNIYRTLGFVFSHTSPPNYWYTKDYRNVFHRQKFQKHKLATLLEIFDERLSEWENMQNNGWDRIWDCGNDVFVWQDDFNLNIRGE